MNDVELILLSLAKLELHYPTRRMTTEEHDLYFKDYVEDLKVFGGANVERACETLRRDASVTRFPTIGQIRQLCAPMVYVQQSAKARCWTPASPDEYAAMSLQAKIREKRLLAQDARNQASRHYDRDKPRADQGEAWKFLIEQSLDYERGALLLADRAHEIASEDLREG